MEILLLMREEDKMKNERKTTEYQLEGEWLIKTTRDGHFEFENRL